jgi:predicted CXXCH cytochrome family protein
LRAVIRYVTRKSRGGIAIREQVSDTETVVVGRGNDCAMHLPDPRVLLRHAEFTVRNGDLYISAPATADLRVNGNLTQTSRLQPGDKVRIGPYEVTVESPADSADVILAVELVAPLDDDLERLVAMARGRIGRIGLSVRGWSWLFAALILAATFAIPLGLNLFGGREGKPSTNVMGGVEHPVTPTRVWSSGEISSVHKFFGDQCETCHETPFIPVQDQACLGCHEAIPHHADPVRFTFAAFQDESCQSCHKEHRGNAVVARSDEAFCGSCHRDLTKRATNTDLRNVSRFGLDHPQFRPTVLADVPLHIVDRSRSIDDAPRESSGLKFPHNKHLRPEGVRDPARGTVQLDCADCHEPDATGATLKPIAFEEHCHRCHVLKFDSFIPDRELLHGKPEELLKQVQDIYSAVALRGGYTEPEAPLLVRRRPGTTLTAEEKAVVTDWATMKTESVINGRFGKGICAECHQLIDPGQGEAAGTPDGPRMVWNVEPATLSSLYFPKAYFNHAPHRDVECTTCHEALGSVSSTDVLMPGVEVCGTCHGSETATDRVPSPCITCHVFHRKDLPPMHPSPVGDTAAASASGGLTGRAAQSGGQR